MSETVRATCPGCSASLRIPADWAGRPVRCKKCGATVRAKSGGRPAAAPPAPVAKRAAPPTPAPADPPAAIPVAVPAPVADPIPVPQAIPVAAEPAGAELIVGDLPLAYVRRRSARRGPVAWIAVALLLAAVTAGAVFGLPYLQKQKGGTAVVTPPTIPTQSTLPAPTAARAGFPRRMLVISATRYLYCNRLAGGTDRSGDPVGAVARRVAFDWRVPLDPANSQLYVLSDTATKDPRPLLKPVILETLAGFCDTSRPQDRVVIYFGGHAAEVDGKPYLVPAEGDLTDAASLIPLDDFWAKVKACKAAQRVVLFDVCRLNEDDDRVRPGSDPMTPGLEKALLAAPPGVEVVISCSAGQTAAEFRRPPASDVSGSLFLSSLKQAQTKKTEPAKPDDLLPIAEWVKATSARIKEVADATGRPVQTPKRAGEPPASPPPADPTEPPARFDLPAPPKGASRAEVEQILKRLHLPPIREASSADDDQTELLLPFPAEVMKDYRPDGEADGDKQPHRKAAVDALATIDKEWGRTSTAGVRGGLRYEFSGETNDRVKKTIEREQEVPARVIIRMEQTVRRLDELADTLDQEPSKYWRATFQYARAQAKARLAFMHEYNVALGLIRTDSLPTVDASKGQDGLQLVSVEKMKSKKKEVADEAKELFGKIATDHKGTPWAVAAAAGAGGRSGAGVAAVRPG
ncbi:MAG: caspase family protein [Gemmataceae bacterium]